MDLTPAPSMVKGEYLLSNGFESNFKGMWVTTNGEWNYLDTCSERQPSFVLCHAEVLLPGLAQNAYISSGINTDIQIYYIYMYVHSIYRYIWVHISILQYRYVDIHKTFVPFVSFTT